MKKLVSNTAVPEIIVVSEGIEEKRCKIIQNLSDNNGLKRQVLWLTKASKNASNWKFRETEKHTKAKTDKSMQKYFLFSTVPYKYEKKPVRKNASSL